MYGCSQELPILSKLDPAEYGAPESAITREVIQRELKGITVEEVMVFKLMSHFVLLVSFLLNNLILGFTGDNGEKVVCTRLS